MNIKPRFYAEWGFAGTLVTATCDAVMPTEITGWLDLYAAGGRHLGTAPSRGVYALPHWTSETLEDLIARVRQLRRN